MLTPRSWSVWTSYSWCGPRLDGDDVTCLWMNWFGATMRNSSNSMLRWFVDLAELGMPKLVKAAFDKTRVSKIAKLRDVNSLRADWKTLSYMLFGAINDLPGKFCQLMFFFGLEIRTRLSELMSCANVGGPLFGNCFRFFLAVLK